MISLGYDVEERRSMWAGYSSKKGNGNAANFAKHAKSGALASLGWGKTEKT